MVCIYIGRTEAMEMKKRAFIELQKIAKRTRLLHWNACWCCTAAFVNCFQNEVAIL